MLKPFSGCPFHQFQHIKEFDALDPAARKDPLPYYDWLRNDASRTVYKMSYESNFYKAHRYDDVNSIFGDAENFSNKIIPSVKSPFFAFMDGSEHMWIRNIVGTFFDQKNILKWEPVICATIEDATKNLFKNSPVALFESWANVIFFATLSELFALDIYM